MSPFLYRIVSKADQVPSLCLGALLQDAIQRKNKIDEVVFKNTIILKA